MGNLKLLSASQLKIVAFFTMMIDHFAYFLYFLLSDNIYYGLRCIGRFSMPIFAFLIYQGIKHTSDLSKYRKRVLALAAITQILTVFMGIIAKNIVPSYNVNFFYKLNILFSFYISIHFVSILDFLLNEKNKKNNATFFMGTMSLLAIVTLFILVPIEYGVLPLLIISLVYVIDQKRDNKVLKYTLLALLLWAFIITVIEKVTPLIMIVSIPIIMMYNGKKGNNYSKVWYYFYPTHIIVLYAIGIITYLYK